MKFGVAIRNMGPQSNRATIRACARIAEQAGFDSLFVSDHLCIPPDQTEGSGGRYLDVLATLAFIAGATEKIRLGVSVLVVPYRPAVLTAKQVATIQELSGERMILGIGVGWMKPEFDALGVEIRRRGAITDETLNVIHHLFSADVPEAYNGKLVQFPSFVFLPRPKRPILWIGGNGSSAVLLGKGDGTFQAPQIYQIGLGDTQGVAVGDLNGDGLPDLLGVALTGGGPPSQPPSSVGVLLNQGNANFGPSPFGTVTLYPVGSLGAAIVLGDFNHDGNLDAAVTNFGTNDISILLGNGDGTFKAQSRFLAGGGPFSLASADFDGTGRIDLVVTTQNAALNGNGVRVFLGNGDGTFRFYQGLATGSSPAYVTVGDFNGDGVPDIAVVDAATNVVSIILTQ